MTPEVIYVELDGALVEPQPEGIGRPVALMLQRIRSWLSQGFEVRILTHRLKRYYYAQMSAYEGDEISRQFALRDGEQFLDDWATWCASYSLPVLTCTPMIGRDCVELWSSRAVAVLPNDGEIKGRSIPVNMSRLAYPPVPNSALGIPDEEALRLFPSTRLPDSDTIKDGKFRHGLGRLLQEDTKFYEFLGLDKIPFRYNHEPGRKPSEEIRREKVRALAVGIRHARQILVDLIKQSSEIEGNELEGVSIRTSPPAELGHSFTLVFRGEAMDDSNTQERNTIIDVLHGKPAYWGPPAAQ